MKHNNYNLIDVVEDISKVSYSIGVFVFKYFYKVSNTEALVNSMDSYMISRFSQRLEYFVYEHKKLTVEEKRSFYNNLSDNKQNLDFLYALIDKAKTTSYDIQVKLLARLSVELIRNKKFNYHELTLLNIVDSLNDIDFNNIYNNINYDNKSNIKINSQVKYIINNNEDLYTYEKCIRLGIFDKLSQENFIYTMTNEVRENEINSLSYQKIVTKELTNLILKLLDDIIPLA